MKRTCFLNNPVLHASNNMQSTSARWSSIYSQITSKLFFIVALLILPTMVFGQDMYDDLYSKPSKDKSARIQKPKQQLQTETPAENEQYKIETTRVGNNDVVVVRNMAGDTVYYSGDNQIQAADNTVSGNAGGGEYANRIKRFHNPNGGTIIINGVDGEDAYPLDNVNWTVNVYGGGFGWPYWSNSYYPYYGYGRSLYSPWYSSFYSPWYSSWYDPYWDWNFGFDYGWSYYSNWYSPYYGYGGYYGWGGYPYYSGGWYGGSNWRHNYNYTGDSRRLANAGGNGRSQASQFSSSTSGSRNNSQVLNSNGASRSSRQNGIGVRGSRENTEFWNDMLSNRGYNVSGRGRTNSVSNNVNSSNQIQTQSPSSRGSYSSRGAGTTYESVQVQTSPSRTNYGGSRTSSSSDYNRTASDNNRSSSYSSSSSSSSSSSGSRSSYSSSSSSYSGGSSSSGSYSSGSSSSGGGSRGSGGGGGGGRR